MPSNSRDGLRGSFLQKSCFTNRVSHPFKYHKDGICSYNCHKMDFVLLYIVQELVNIFVNLYITMKKPLICLLTVGTLLWAPMAFADNDNVTVPLTPIITAVSADTESDDQKKEERHRNTKNSNSLPKLQARGEHLINVRLGSLKANNQAILSSKLTTEQKTSLTAILGANTSSLTTLKASIATSADATSTKALIDSIYTQYRIYGIVIPQVRLEKRIYDLQNHVTKLSDSFVKVEAKINEYKAKGKDVSIWQKGVDDAKLLVATDVAKLSTLLTQTRSLTPASYGTSSKATIESINKELKAVAKDFNSIQKAIRKPAKLNNVSASGGQTSTTTVR